jgi:hypothetical protein
LLQKKEFVPGSKSDLNFVFQILLDAGDRDFSSMEDSGGQSRFSWGFSEDFMEMFH